MTNPQTTQPRTTRNPPSDQNGAQHACEVVATNMWTVNHKRKSHQPTCLPGPRKLLNRDLPIPTNHESMAVTQDAPCPQDESNSPNEEGLHQRAFLNAFESLFPCSFAIDNASLPNDVFVLEFMPLHLVGNLVIAFNPNGPHDNASEKIPNSKPMFIYFSRCRAQKCRFTSWILEWVLSCTT